MGEDNGAHSVGGDGERPGEGASDSMVSEQLSSSVPGLSTSRTSRAYLRRSSIAEFADAISLSVRQNIARAPGVSHALRAEKAPVPFKDFRPSCFARVRRAFGVSDEVYSRSFERMKAETKSEGASDAFLFFTKDERLVIKSMNAKESLKLRRIAEQYAAYMELNPGTLLPRFYGCHAVRLCEYRLD